MSGGLDSTLVAGFARKNAEAGFGSSDVHAHAMIWNWRIEDEEKYWAPRAAAGMNIPYHPMPIDEYLAFPGWDDEPPRSPLDPEVIHVLGTQPEPFNFPLYPHPDGIDSPRQLDIPASG